MLGPGSAIKMAWGGLLMHGGPRPLIHQRMKEMNTRRDEKPHVPGGDAMTSVLHGFPVPGSSLSCVFIPWGP